MRTLQSRLLATAVSVTVLVATQAPAQSILDDVLANIDELQSGLNADIKALSGTYAKNKEGFNFTPDTSSILDGVLARLPDTDAITGRALAGVPDAAALISTINGRLPDTDAITSRALAGIPDAAALTSGILARIPSF